VAVSEGKRIASPPFVNFSSTSAGVVGNVAVSDAERPPLREELHRRRRFAGRRVNRRYDSAVAGVVLQGGEAAPLGQCSGAADAQATTVCELVLARRRVDLEQAAAAVILDAQVKGCWKFIGAHIDNRYPVSIAVLDSRLSIEICHRQVRSRIITFINGGRTG